MKVPWKAESELIITDRKTEAAFGNTHYPETPLSCSSGHKRDPHAHGKRLWCLWVLNSSWGITFPFVIKQTYYYNYYIVILIFNHIFFCPINKHNKPWAFLKISHNFYQKKSELDFFFLPKLCFLNCQGQMQNVLHFEMWLHYKWTLE